MFYFYLSIYIYLSIYLSISVYSYIYLYIYISIYLSIYIYLCIYLSIYLSIHLSVYVSQVGLTNLVSPGSIHIQNLRARRKQLQRSSRLLPENGSSQGQDLALTVLHVPDSLDSGIYTTCPIHVRALQYLHLDEHLDAILHEKTIESKPLWK